MNRAFKELSILAIQTGSVLESELERACGILKASLEADGKVLACGNGGSAADAQHFAAELTGHMRKERRPYPSLALSSDPSAVTAIANDYGFDNVFARQVLAHGRPGDVLVAISTSGKSPNILRAVEAAHAMGLS